jgi:hypothetical protein
VRTATWCTPTLVLAERFAEARTHEGLAEAGRTALDAAARMVDAANGRSTVAALLGRNEAALFFSIANRVVGLAADDDGI